MKPDEYMAYDGSTALVMAAVAPATAAAAAAFRVCVYVHYMHIYIYIHIYIYTHTYILQLCMGACSRNQARSGHGHIVKELLARGGNPQAGRIAFHRFELFRDSLHWALDPQPYMLHARCEQKTVRPCSTMLLVGTVQRPSRNNNIATNNLLVIIIIVAIKITIIPTLTD